jgi:hypothetical protein
MLPVIAGIALAVLEKIFEKVAKSSQKAEINCAKLQTKCKKKKRKRK